MLPGINQPRLDTIKPVCGKPDREAIEAVMPAVRERLQILDKAVAGSGYLVGDRFTFADINLPPIHSHAADRRFSES